MLLVWRLLSSRDTAGAVGSTSDIRADAIDFLCRAPESVRLQSNCWVKGAVGKYEGSSRMPDSHSQKGEDRIMYEHFFFNRTGGSFIEMGGLDGRVSSNSYFFEAQKDWQGLLVEGSPKNSEKMFLNRPKAVAVNAMVCRESRDLHWIDHFDIGGAWELFTDELKERWYSGRSEESWLKSAKIVPCLPLQTILDRFGIRHVDLFSLDVEGAEMSILETIDFSRFTASVIVAEVQHGNYHGAPPVEFIRKAGYIALGYLNKNYYFLHPRFAETLPQPLTRPDKTEVPPWD